MISWPCDEDRGGGHDVAPWSGADDEDQAAGLDRAGPGSSVAGRGHLPAVQVDDHVYVAGTLGTDADLNLADGGVIRTGSRARTTFSLLRSSLSPVKSDRAICTSGFINCWRTVTT